MNLWGTSSSLGVTAISLSRTCRCLFVFDDVKATPVEIWWFNVIFPPLCEARTEKISGMKIDYKSRKSVTSISIL